MGNKFSCPSGYEMLTQNADGGYVRLCIEKQMIDNISVITDIMNPTYGPSSGVSQLDLSWLTAFWLTCLIWSLLRR